MSKSKSLKKLFWEWFRLFLIWLCIVSVFAFVLSFALALLGMPTWLIICIGLVCVATFEFLVWQRHTNEFNKFDIFISAVLDRIFKDKRKRPRG